MPEIEINAMSFGPYGVGHLDGKTVMVPHAAPGDRLDVELVAHRRDYSLGEIRTIAAPGPDRRNAPCPYLPRCGGCDWQHLAYPAQVRIKAELVAGTLNRALGLQLDPANLIEPAPDEFGYRARIRLKAGAHGVLGFRGFGTDAMVEVDSCMVAEPGMRMPVHLARTLARKLDEIEVVRAGERDVLVGYLKKPPGTEEIQRARRVVDADPAIAGIVLRAGEKREVIGAATTKIELEDGLWLEADADLFSQVNREQNQKLIAEVIAMASSLESAAVLDLFCGAGNFSLPIARRGARVTGVDADAPAIAAAARNAARLGLRNTQFIAMKASETADFLRRARYKPDVVILDPPRTGAAELMEQLLQLRASRIIYVSCDVTTLARDLRMLADGNYEIGSLRAFDFFPNTHHIEIAAQVLLT
jgi:23S rRNA (uracil1939-C5)-methyltransferase